MLEFSDRTPFVGRGREQAVIAERLRVLQQGPGSVIMLAGEPGIGKTRLLDEAAAEAASRGVTVLRGGASEAEGMPPYLPFLEALGRYIRAAPPERLQIEAGPWAGILASILPELALRLGALPATPPLPAEQARLRLFEAVAELLAAIAERTPLLLLLDDLQWADRAGLELLSHVTRTLSGARVAVLGAYRAGELTANPALQQALDDLSRLRVLTTLTLQPLGEAELGAIAASCLGAATDPALTHRLHEQSEGNPFFAEELVRGWVEAGDVAEHSGSWTLNTARDADHERRLPPTIAGAIRRRLSRLPTEVLACLQTAAVAGRAFGVGLVAQVEGLDPEALEGRLQQAVVAGLLRARADGSFLFYHDRVRECINAELTATRRARLHAAIGAALEQEAEQADAQRLAELTFHFARSGDRARGARYSEQAGRSALAAYAATDAMQHFRVALDLLDSADARRGELLLALAEALLLAGEAREAALQFEAARDRLLARGERVAAARASRGAGSAWRRVEENAAARRAFERSLALLDDESGEELVRTLVELADLLGVSFGRADEAREHARQALALARGLGEPRLLAPACRTAGNLLVRSNRLHEGIELLEEGLALARAAGDDAEGSECCAQLTMACVWLGDVQRADEVLAERRAFAERSHDRYQLRHLDAMLAMGAALRGNWQETAALLDQAEAAIALLSSPEPRAYLHLCRAGLTWMRGDYAAAEPLVEQAIAEFRALGPDALIWYLGGLGIVYAGRGRRADARAVMDELAGLIEAQPPESMQAAEPLTYYAVIALSLGDRERLGFCYPRLLPFQGQMHDYLVDRLLGATETLCGDWQRAAAHLEAAERMARRGSLRPELLQTLAARADLVLARDGARGAAEAASLLDEALALAEELAIQPEVGRLLDRLERLRGRERRRRALPAGLSVREAEVLVLVAAGRSNREIAEALVLSEHTVANHLTSIFNKIGCENRAAATAWAVRQGLA